MMTEVMERAPPVPIFAEDAPTPLPSRWSEHDKFAGLELMNGGLEMKFSAASKAHDSEAASVRADHPMPRECGIYYYEVTVISKSKDGYVCCGLDQTNRLTWFSSLISIGVSSAKVPLNRLPGWEPESWAYHGDDGMAFSSSSSGRVYGPKYSTMDVVGCGVNFRTGSIFFTKNGVYLGKHLIHGCIGAIS